MIGSRCVVIATLLLGCGSGSGGFGPATSGAVAGSDSGASTGYMPVACEADGSSSHIGEDGRCYCDAGFTWANPFDPNDASCIDVGQRAAKGQACDAEHGSTNGNACECDDGYRWCSDDTHDLSCCVDDAQEHPGGATSVVGDSTAAGSSAGASTGTSTDTGTGSSTG